MVAAAQPREQPGAPVPGASAQPELSPRLGRLFGELDRRAVSWCVLRRDDELARAGDDVDLLVHPEQLEAVLPVLQELDFVELPASGRGSHRFFLGYDAAAGLWLQLDIVTELAFGRLLCLKTDAAPSCLARRRRRGGVPVLAQDDALWALLLHCLLDRRGVTPADQTRLERIARSATAGGALERAVADRCPAFEPREIEAAVRRADWAAVAAAGRELGRSWTRARLGSVGIELARAVPRRIAEKPFVALRRPGLIVAVLGIDGAGKSTLVDRLSREVPLPARVVYGGLWRTRDAGRRRDAVARVLRPAFRIGVVWARYSRARYHRAVGRLVLFDRYTYDALLPPRPPLVVLKRLYFRLLASSCPRPDLLVLLDLPGSVAAVRRAGESPAELETQRQSFLELQRRVPDLVVLDATRSFGRVKADAGAAVWRRYQERRA